MNQSFLKPALALFFLLLFLGGVSVFNLKKAPPKKQIALKGIALGIHTRTLRKDIDQSLTEVKNLGANTILIKVTEFQDDWQSNIIRPNPEITISINKLNYALTQAKKLQLSLILMPVVLLENVRSKTDWRGMIEPLDVEGWFDSYTYMILKYARISQKKAVDFLAIGSELVSMEPYTEQWEKVIDRVRQVYEGHLFYSSNWDHLETTSAWEKLDFLGCNAYFELSSFKEKTSPKELMRRITSTKDEIFRWVQSSQKPIIITEVGFPSRTNALFNPWDHTAKGEPDPDIQLLAYHEFLKAWSTPPTPYGIILYEWDGAGGPKDTGYTPRGKPAEKVIQSWLNSS